MLPLTPTLSLNGEGADRANFFVGIPQPSRERGQFDAACLAQRLKLGNVLRRGATAPANQLRARRQPLRQIPR